MYSMHAGIHTVHVHTVYYLLLFMYGCSYYFLLTLSVAPIYTHAYTSKLALAAKGNIEAIKHFLSAFTSRVCSSLSCC